MIVVSMIIGRNVRFRRDVLGRNVLGRNVSGCNVWTPDKSLKPANSVILCRMKLHIVSLFSVLWRDVGIPLSQSASGLG